MSISTDFPDYKFEVFRFNEWLEAGKDPGVEVEAMVTYAVRTALLAEPERFKKDWDEVKRYIIGLRVETAQELHVYYMGKHPSLPLESNYFELEEDKTADFGGPALDKLFGNPAGMGWRAFVPPSVNPKRRFIRHTISTDPDVPSTVSWKVKVQIRRADTLQKLPFVGRYLFPQGAKEGWLFGSYADGTWNIPVARAIQAQQGGEARTRSVVVGLPGGVRFLD